MALQRFAGPKGQVQLLYSDGSLEIEKAAQALGWLHDTCTPDRKQTNGVAERAVKRVLEGSRTALYTSGLEHAWWPTAARAFCYLRCISDADGPGGKPAYEIRFDEPFPGMLIPFGAAVDYKPAAAKETGRRKKFDPRAEKGIR